METALASYDMGVFILLFDVSVNTSHGKFQMVFYQGKSVPCIGSFISCISAVSSSGRPPRETNARKRLKFRLDHLTGKKESSKHCFKAAIATVW